MAHFVPWIFNEWATWQAWSFHRPNVSQHGPLPRPNQARLFIPFLRLPRFRDRRQGRDGRGRQDHACTAHLSENHASGWKGTLQNSNYWFVT